MFVVKRLRPIDCYGTTLSSTSASRFVLSSWSCFVSRYKPIRSADCFRRTVMGHKSLTRVQTVDWADTRSRPIYIPRKGALNLEKHPPASQSVPVANNLAETESDHRSDHPVRQGESAPAIPAREKMRRCRKSRKRCPKIRRVPMLHWRGGNLSHMRTRTGSGPGTDCRFLYFRSAGETW